MKNELKTSNTVKYKSRREYREAYKIAVLSDLVSNQESDSFICRKHGIPSSSFSRVKHEMLDKYGYFRILEGMKKKDKPEKSAQELAAENEELKKALELSVMKVAALETLIDVVDNQLNINIRKKGGSKQSK
jgi:transposase-like protein